MAYTLPDSVLQWKREGKKIVFTNGCFDLLHRGHVSYLQTARSFGDVLVVGLNSDASVKRLKGPSRPINDESSRAFILSALRCVDAVILFEEDTPLELIKTLMPQVLVKGADYTAENIVGYKEVTQAGGEVKTVTFIEGHSTTATIQRLAEENEQ